MRNMNMTIKTNFRDYARAKKNVLHSKKHVLNLCFSSLGKEKQFLY